MFLLQVLKDIAKQLAVALVTEKFVKEIIVYALKKLAEKTDNKVDDELVAKVDEALHSK